MDSEQTRARTEAPIAETPVRIVDGRRARRFSAGLLFGAVAILLLIGAFNAVVDPYGTVDTKVLPTAILSDRATKVCLAKRLSVTPQIIVLGSSRAMKAQPAYLTQKTGLPAFNAGVSSGTPDDAWGFVNFLHDRFPHAREHYLWFLDVEAFRNVPLDSGLLDTPDLARYFPSSQGLSTRLHGIWPLFSWRASGDSWRVVTAWLEGRTGGHGPSACVIRTNGVTQFAPDGYRRWDFHDLIQARGGSFAQQLAATERQYSRIYRREYRGLFASPRAYFERTLERLNGWKITPVIVLSPVYPALLGVIGRLGWNRRHEQVVRYLASLRRRYRFQELDLTRISSFHGSLQGFYDGVHMKVGNMQRLLDVVLAHSRRTLTGSGA